jgi:cytochrome c oxidase subunit 2
VTVRRPRRALVGVLALVLLVGAGCGGHSPSMLDPHGSEARSIAGVWWLMFAIAAAVYVIVAGLIVFALVRGRRRAHDLRVSDDGLIWVGGVIAPVVILAVLAVVTVTTTMDLRPASAEAVRVEVVGKRWWWDVSYPGTGIRTADEIRLPVGRPVDLILRSDNVVHSFWVPQLAGKVDMIPGQTNHLRFTPEKVGVYRGACAEFCGIDHGRMSFTITVDRASDYERWIVRRQAATADPTSERTAQGQRIFMRESCAGCHSIRGTQATGTIGPDLTDFGSRRWIGAITVRNTPSNLAAWITDPQDAKPGNLMPPTSLSRAELDAVVAYLESLR